MTCELRSLGPDDCNNETLVKQLLALLAARHRAHRAVQPLLDPFWQQRTRVRDPLVEALADPSASGVVALQDGRPVGFLLGRRRQGDVWGPNVWVESAGLAVTDAELARDLYAAAAQAWVDAGRTAHYVLVPAHDTALVDAFFRLGFGLQHVHGARRPAPAGPLPDGVQLRPAAAADIEVLVQLDRELPLHQARSPVFWSGPVPTEAEAAQEWAESLQDPRFTSVVAEVDGVVVGVAMALGLEMSGMHRGLAALDHAGFLGFAVVQPSARGRGAGRALGEAVLDWAHQCGHRSVVTDWRATNLLSSRTWPRLGFEPTFLRLHRVTGY